MKNLILFNQDGDQIKKYYVLLTPKNNNNSPLKDMINRLDDEQQQKWRKALIKLEKITRDW